jgi:DNA-binding winged helix-turn-helix (wHTH) protein
LQTSGDHPNPGECSIGEWIFSPASNELRRGFERRRLEHRAARTLELLCLRRGAIVSQEEILAEVWNGRTISPNGVPVVIKDLRQALGDDARDPRHIETISKRGYRLLPPSPALTSADPPAVRVARRRHWPLLVLSAAMVVLLAVSLTGVASTGSSDRDAVRLMVADVENATGSPRYQSLATATSDLIILNAQRLEGVRVLRGTKAGSIENALTLSTRLILWEGRPTAMMSAQDATGAVVWTSMTSGDEALIPREVSAAIEDFGRNAQPVPSD